MTKRNSTGVGHDGRSNAFAKPGEPTLAAHHSPMDARAHDHGIAPSFMKPAAKKALPDVSIHNGMHSRQIAAAGLGGLGHASAVLSGGQVIAANAAAVPPVPAHRKNFNSPDASQVSAPITQAYGKGVPKVRDAAPAKAGMRSRQGPLARSLTDSTPHSILGRAILEEAHAIKPTIKVEK
jgi:hypothetical protein